jgi:hypothetical protein
MENAMPEPESRAFFQTRGVVIVPSDLSLADWPERAKKAGLTTIALHPTPNQVTAFITSEAGQAFLNECRELHLEIEYELHAIGELLPREMFAKSPSMFRMNDEGQRVADANLCVYSDAALDVVMENAVKIAQRLRPTTGRYFYWGDDNQPWCRCPKCKGLSASDQALLLENHLLDALRKIDSKAQVAHLAYGTTIEPPKQVAPQPGIFLEFAPIQRRHDVALSAVGVPENKRYLELLDANLRVFPPHTAQALEYWLDCSRFSNWKRPAVKIPWHPEVLEADLDTYGGRGIHLVTSFAVYVDADYVRMYGEPPLEEYGAALRAWPKKR